MSKRILAFILTCLMCLSLVSAVACNKTETTPVATETPAVTTPTAPGTTATTPTGVTTEKAPTTIAGSTENPFEGEVGTEEKTHTALETVPSSYTLVGSDYLPPIDNQGSVGSCASESVAYMQFSNAVARYLASVDANSEFKPAKSDAYCFSPKFTYLLSGAGTEWVYNLLSDQGCTMADTCGFYKVGTASQIKNGAGFFKQSLKWDVAKDELFNALNYRVGSYEQIWNTKSPYNGEMTTSERGKELLAKIKEAVASGNVVVTGGYPSRWQMTNVVNPGTLGKIGQRIIGYSLAEGDGGHQVCIVGYDDAIQCKVGDTVLTGAFLIANSWGTTWGNNGYVWVAYDALNTVSEYEELNDEEYKRGWTLDQFCFLYWDCDIIVGQPELMCEIEVEATDREKFYFQLTREDATGNVTTYTPYMFRYGAADAKIHDSYGVTNFGGDVDTGIKDTGYFTLSYQALTKLIPAGKTIEDYNWGVKAVSLASEKGGETVIIKSVKLIDSTKKVLAEIIPTGEQSDLSNGQDVNFKFSFKSELSDYRMSGTCIISANEKYMSVPALSISYIDGDAKATKFDLIYDSVAMNYTIKKSDGNYVLDISGKEIKPDVEVKFNALSPTRETQTWKLLNNGDGTYTIYLEKNDENGFWYAVGIKDGKTVLVTGDEIETYGKFVFTSSVKAEDVTVNVKNDNGTYKLLVTNNSKKEVTSVTVYDAEGKEVASAVAGTEKDLGALASGNYTVIAVHPDMSVVYYFTVK